MPSSSIHIDVNGKYSFFFHSISHIFYKVFKKLFIHERQTAREQYKKQTVNYIEETEHYQKEDGCGMGEIRSGT